MQTFVKLILLIRKLLIIKGDFRAQLFTSLMTDLRHYINRAFSFSRSLNGRFPRSNCSVMNDIGTIQMRIESSKCKSSLLSYFTKA